MKNNITAKCQGVGNDILNEVEQKGISITCMPVPQCSIQIVVVGKVDAQPQNQRQINEVSGMKFLLQILADITNELAHEGKENKSTLYQEF